MNQSTKQRIVGTLVLLIAALVLLPVMLDGDGNYEAPLESRIPAPPPFEEPARAIPERPVILADGRRSTTADESTLGEAPPASTADSVEATDTEPQAGSVGEESGDAPATAAGAGLAPVAIEDPVTASAPEVAATVDDPVALALAEVASRTPRLDEQGLPRGWSVRLGVFGDAGNAAALVERLKAADHRAYTRASSSSNGPATAVYVGPLIDRAGAETLLEQLRTEFQLNGLVVPYEIETR